jgi:alkanesulfonate monooxygenase
VWDALIMTTAMATATEKIGLVATAHTEYHEPYALARQLACLDHLSRGRAGWNVVTSSGLQDARNFSDAPPPSGEERYEKAAEFVELVKRLWDSWEDDAYVLDQERGIYFDPDKLHPTAFHGQYYYADGPLNVMRPPQGYPVIAQAGTSGPGRMLAGAIAELIFTPLTGDMGRAYRDDIHRLAAEAGRDPRGIKVLAQITPVMGRTDEEAAAKWKWLQDRLDPDVALGQLGAMLAVDLSGFPLDEPLPDLPDNGGIQGYRQAVQATMGSGRRPTLREMISEVKGVGTVVGSAATVADYMEAEVANGACDGFVLCLQGTPEELEDFVEFVVPELQCRGRFRTEYEADTLRGHFGFSRPSNQFVGVKRI